MSEIFTNPMTGEVSFKLGDLSFSLHATMPRLAQFQAETNTVGLGALSMMVARQDARAVYLGLKCLCSSGNAEKLETMLLMPHLEQCADAISKALVAGLPEAKPSRKKPTPKAK